jgi:hypothetical protein
MTSYPQDIIDFLPSHLSLDELVAKAKSNRKSNTTTHTKHSINIKKPTLHSTKQVSSYSLSPHLYKKIFHNSVPDNPIKFKC